MEKESVLKTLPFWNNLSQIEKTQIVQNSQIQSFRKDHVLHGSGTNCLGAIVVLDGELAREGIFPATDIAQSGTMKDELLLSPEELAAARAVRAALLRGLRNTDVINYMAQTSDNLAFVANSKNFLEKFK